MRPRLLIPALLHLVLAAHPAVGLVQDLHGNVYYSDLKQVWRISPEGHRTLAVPRVHTHELCLDPEGNLFGEHLWYTGGPDPSWGHRVWRRSPDGTLRDILPASPGFLKGTSFVRDARGVQYGADRGPTTTLWRRAPGAEPVGHAHGPFRDVRWMTVTPEGVLYLIDGTDLLRIGPGGEARTLVRDLQPRRSGRGPGYDPHALMGLWTDPAGRIYVAAFADREVRRVDREGRVAVVARSPRGWAPSGGLVAPDGALWLLEWSPANTARVRRIKDGSERTWGPDAPSTPGPGSPT